MLKVQSRDFEMDDYSVKKDNPPLCQYKRFSLLSPYLLVLMNIYSYNVFLLEIHVFLTYSGFISRYLKKKM